MIIDIDTSEELSEVDREILQLLLATNATNATAAADTPEEKLEEEEAPTPKRRRRTKAEMEAARAAEAKDDEPEATDEEDDDDLLGGDDEPEYTTKMAIEKATELLSAGKGVDVKKALGVAGAKKVSDLKDQESLAAFFSALDG